MYGSFVVYGAVCGEVSEILVSWSGTQNRTHDSRLNDVLTLDILSSSRSMHRAMRKLINRLCFPDMVSDQLMLQEKLNFQIYAIG